MSGEMAASATSGQESQPAVYDWEAINNDLNKLLRLRTTPIGMKMFESVEEMDSYLAARQRAVNPKA